MSRDSPGSTPFHRSRVFAASALIYPLASSVSFFPFSFLSFLLYMYKYTCNRLIQAYLSLQMEHALSFLNRRRFSFSLVITCLINHNTLFPPARFINGVEKVSYTLSDNKCCRWSRLIRFLSFLAPTILHRNITVSPFNF